MIYIKMFRDLRKNILPENGRILELVKQPGQAGTKKEGQLKIIKRIGTYIRQMPFTGIPTIDELRATFTKI
jgi:hypothetical protein